MAKANNAVRCCFHAHFITLIFMNKNPFYTSPLKLILASGSPRRQQLLKGLDLNFEVKIYQTDESFSTTMAISEVPIYLAEQKSTAFFQNFIITEDVLVITADTIVVLDDEIINKPLDKEDAMHILKKLSGKRHQVITGVCLQSKTKKISFSDSSFVVFKNLTELEIEYYVTHYKPYDKAGSYGIQEWIGYVAIEKIEGSFYNVMGLPTEKLWSELQKF